MWTVFGIVVGLLIYRLVIVPIERERYRKECIRKGWCKREFENNRIWRN